MLIPMIIISCFFLSLIYLFWNTKRFTDKLATTVRSKKIAFDEHIIKLRITVQFILSIIPFAVFLLGFLGYATYDDLVRNASEAIRTELNAAEITKVRIDSINKEIDSLYKNAKQDADSIRKTLANLNLSLLPIGSIVAYHGQSGTLPKGWRLCDGTDGTPDLRQKFIMGSDFDGIKKVGGQIRHKFNLQFQNPLGQISVNGTHAIGIQSGNGAIRNIDIPDRFQLSIPLNSFNINPLQGDELPPYYTLAYIIKTQ